MADTKITALAPIGAIDPANDVLPIVDVSNNSMAASGTTCRVTTNQLLQANAIASLASATISGDLTVDTSTLVVNPAGYPDRVGIGTATPALPLDVNGAIQTTSGSAAGLFQWAYGASASSRSWRAWNDVSANGDFQISTSTTRTGSTYSDRYRIDVSGVHEWSNTSGPAMTLNATGLGVGTIPGGSTGSSKIAVVGGATYDGNFDIIANFTNSTASAAKGVLLGYNNSTNNGIISAAYGSGTEGLTFWTHNGSSWGQRMELTATGNVGIGVQPSAWASYKALQVGSIGSLSSTTGATIVGNNWFYDGASKYITTAASTIYEQGAGTHAWYSAASGTAGTAVSFGSAKMTLDASGNLILLSSNTPATLTTNGQLTVNATSNTNLRFSYRGSDGVTRVANITLA